jgi:hypothetical protein
MRQSFAGIAVTVSMALLSANAFGADSQLLNLVMPDAQVMAGMNITNSEVTPLGTFILSKVSGSADLQQLIAQTGFDPRKDLTEVLAASNGNTATPSSLVLAKGTFDVPTIVAAIKAKSTTQQISTYDGATLITGTAAADKNAIAFLGTTIVLAGDAASVKAALDRSGAVNSINPALATQVQALSTSQDAWSVSLASLGSLIPAGAASSAPGDGMGGMVAGLAKNIVSSSAGVKFGASVQFTAQAVSDNAQDASSLADVVKMVASLAAMSAANNPQMAGVAQLAQSLQVSTSGATVNLSASLPEAQVEALLSSATTAKPNAIKPRKM